MDRATRSSKLAELRARTDYDLVHIIAGQLERARMIGCEAAGQGRSGLSRAEEMCSQAQLWMTLVEDPSRRLQVETQWKQARQALDRLAHAGPRRFISACC